MGALAYVLLFFLGAIFASFACVIAERLGTGESWHKGRSRCNACGRTLATPDLIPVVSYILFAGRCRTCTAKIPPLYTVTEVTLGTVFALSYARLGVSPALPVLLTFSFLLTVLTVYDLRHTIVPFKLSLLLVLLGAAAAGLTAGSLSELSVRFLVAGLIGLFFYGMHVLSRGRWMGLGDTPIALALSLVAGKYAFTGLLFSFWIGAVVGIFLLVLMPQGRKINSEVPFVPFLALGYFLAFFTQWNLLAFM